MAGFFSDEEMAAANSSMKKKAKVDRVAARAAAKAKAKDTLGDNKSILKEAGPNLGKNADVSNTASKPAMSPEEKQRQQALDDIKKYKASGNYGKESSGGNMSKYGKKKKAAPATTNAPPSKIEQDIENLRKNRPKYM